MAGLVKTALFCLSVSCMAQNSKKTEFPQIASVSIGCTDGWLEPNDHTVHVGERVTVELKWCGSTKPKYQWEHAGTSSTVFLLRELNTYKTLGVVYFLENTENKTIRFGWNCIGKSASGEQSFNSQSEALQNVFTYCTLGEIHG